MADAFDAPELNLHTLGTETFAYDCNPKLNGATLSSATATLTDPDGNTAALTTTPTVASGVATYKVTAAEIDQVGTWYVDLLCTLSDGRIIPAYFVHRVTRMPTG